MAGQGSTGKALLVQRDGGDWRFDDSLPTG